MRAEPDRWKLRHLIQGISADNKIEVEIRIGLIEQMKGLGAVGTARPAQFKVRIPEIGNSFNSQFYHILTEAAVRYVMIPLMRRMAGGHKPDGFQIIFPVGLMGQQKMSIVDGVKCSSHNSDGISHVSKLLNIKKLCLPICC